MNIKTKIRNIALYTLFLLIISEVFLRLQQKIDQPIYDLEMRNVTTDILSDTLNHKPAPGKTVFYWCGKKKEKCYDKYGIRINKLIPDLRDDPDAFKILFMGDSFMEGYDDENTIPQQTWKYLQETELRNRKISLLNAGHTSYSTVIFIPQAKKLIPLFKPDLVVIDIDETDMGDDYMLYKDFIVRDNQNKIIGVKKTPIHDFFIINLIKIRTQPLYLTRLISKIFFTRIHMPQITKEYRKNQRSHTLYISTDTSANARETYDKEISFFKENVTELIETLINLMKDRERIMVIYHPHLQHLKQDKNGLYWNTFVSETLEDVTTSHNVAFYNATADLKRAFKDNPGKYYIPNDMHFTFEGQKIYALFVAEKILPKIKKLIK
ncbi:MAG: hypothetical protein A2Z72_07360 [Omnitrophica bacterium RBG_13_46_9]|nr:MAG: hypothetical protein A2Z72_07360 [Omnitrophica bacterium RBG_13_46_9]